MERTASRPIELAFYGGTFTALPERLQMECLALAMQAKEKGIVCRVRCSTRPDALRPDRLQALRHAGLDLVELGIQSFHTEALLDVQRGYNGDRAREGCRLIKESGLKLGIQLLPGMPGSTPQRFSEDVEEALAFSPSCLRFYPCLVVDGTPLAERWRMGQYAPWELDTTITTLGKALASAWAALTWTGVPGGLRILCAILMGFAFGGLWALIAAMFKAKLGISEIIVTIMLNYIAINFLGIAVRTFLMDPAGSIPQSPKLDPSVTLYRFLKPTRLHAGFIIAVLMVFLVWFILEKTTVGYEIKVVGFNKRAAACNGISVVRNIIISAFLSGGLAGIAGAVEVMGVQRKLLEGISGECGYTAVLIALLASNHPVGVLFAAIGFAALEVGANSMQRQMGVPSAIVNILVGLIVLLILGRELFNRKRKGEKPC